jgi:hypothetical protein
LKELILICGFGAVMIYILDVNRDEKIDLDEIWTRSCEGDREAIAICKPFLWDYVNEISIRWVIVLGLEECVEEDGQFR